MPVGPLSQVISRQPVVCSSQAQPCLTTPRIPFDRFPEVALRQTVITGRIVDFSESNRLILRTLVRRRRNRQSRALEWLFVRNAPPEERDRKGGAKCA